MNPVMISVVIPLYNKEVYILDSLKSVMSQTYQHFEVIVVDDGSKDKSADLVNQIHDERISLLKQQNQGVSVARNVGIAAAKYDYIAFLDADDKWHPDYLETISRLINTFPEAGAFATCFQIVKKNGRFEQRKLFGFYDQPFEGLIPNYFSSATFGNHPFYTSSVCVHKKVFSEVGGFPPGIKLGEDIDTWARLALHFNIAFCSEVKVDYNQQTEGNAMQTNVWSYEWPFPKYFDNVLSNTSLSIPNERDVKEYIAKVKLEAIAMNLNAGKPAYAYTLLNSIETTVFRRRKLIFKYILYSPVYFYNILKLFKNMGRGIFHHKN